MGDLSPELLEFPLVTVHWDTTSAAGSSRLPHPVAAAATLKAIAISRSTWLQSLALSLLLMIEVSPSPGPDPFPCIAEPPEPRRPPPGETIRGRGGPKGRRRRGPTR